MCEALKGYFRAKQCNEQTKLLINLSVFNGSNDD